MRSEQASYKRMQIIRENKIWMIIRGCAQADDSLIRGCLVGHKIINFVVALTFPETFTIS